MAKTLDLHIMAQGEYKYLDSIKTFGKAILKAIGPEPEKIMPVIAKERHMSANAYYYGQEQGTLQIFGISYNGEKNLGEMGPIKAYQLDYNALQLRSWQAYLESSIAHTLISKKTKAIIGSGLKLQCNPHMKVLEAEGIKFDAEKFNDTVEAYFESFCKSKSSDCHGKYNLRKQMSISYTNREVGGDVLVILRVNKPGQITVQLIDGSHIWNPIMGNDYYAYKVPDNQPGAGNNIRNGIEYNDNGEVVAYYVRTANPAAGYSYYTGSFERVEAKSKSTGLTMAYIVTGLEYRIDNKRGMPALAPIFETIKTMDDYKQSTAITAKERSRLTFQVVHDEISTGANPFVDSLAGIKNAGATATDDIPRDINGISLDKTAMATHNARALNMPKGSEIKTLNQHGDGVLYYKEFEDSNFEEICACYCIPPEVARSMYDSNYSASRAAIKDWEGIIKIERIDFGMQMMQPIYELYFHILVLQNRVQAPGYLKAFVRQDIVVLDAYRHCHWIGSAVANIDPLKEIMAARLKLGETGSMIPFSTVEKILEDLGEMSDVPAIMEQYAKELKLAKKNKIRLPKDLRDPALENPPVTTNEKAIALMKAFEKTMEKSAFENLMAAAQRLIDEDEGL